MTQEEMDAYDAEEALKNAAAGDKPDRPFLDYSAIIGSTRRAGQAAPQPSVGGLRPYLLPQYFEQRLNMAAHGASSQSGNTPLQRIGSFALGMGVAVPAMLEMGGRGIYNAPGLITNGLQASSGVITAPTTEGKIIAGLTAVRDISIGVSSIGLVATPVGRLGPMTAQEMAVSNFSGKIANDAAKATYTLVPAELAANQPLRLTYTPTTNTLSQIRSMPFPERWQAGELYVQELYGSTGQRHFQVPSVSVGGEKIVGSGGRFVDAPVDMLNGGILAGEVKTYGRWRTVGGQPFQQSVPLSDSIKQQVLKDVWLRENIPNYDPRWIFLDAPPSSELSQYLTNKAIIHVIH